MLKFSTKKEALSYLSKVTGKTIKIASYIPLEVSSYPQEILNQIEYALEFKDASDFEEPKQNLQKFKKMMKSIEKDLKKIDKNFILPKQLYLDMLELEKLIDNVIENEDVEDEGEEAKSVAESLIKETDDLVDLVDWSLMG